jgi:hypothetical protein
VNEENAPIIAGSSLAGLSSARETPANASEIVASVMRSMRPSTRPRAVLFPGGR